MLQLFERWTGEATPYGEEEEWVVTGTDGCAVRDCESLRSRFLGVIDSGCNITVRCVRGNRVLVTSPIEGWASIKNEEGTVIVRRAEPDALCCPITKVMFRDVVMVPHSGYSYERSALNHFWEKTKGGARDQGWPRDPMTNVQLPDTSVYPNIAVRLQVQTWLSSNPNRIPEGWPDRQLPPITPTITPPAQGGRFGGYSLGQRICAAHAVRGLRKGDPGVMKGDVGVFKGPIKPYDRAIAEGLAEVVWDSSPAYSFTIPLKVIAPMDKHCGILKKILVEQKQNGITDVELEEKIEKLGEATKKRDDDIESVALQAIESQGQNKGWVSEAWVCDTVLKHLDGPEYDTMKDILGSLQVESIQRTIKRLVRANVLDRSTAAMQDGFPFRARLLRISRSTQYVATQAATAAALIALATLEA
eukprot:TRINITY_DN12191_c1_g1_i1.p1 TRINITY_DN12191_c1_g1~~TRINITY_DN12191_c1_g1_i1.p1  ORF type:complete len:417 (+),score=103.65 TRINITY_DN12191_c1_g1_i1:37-1287(+)